MLEILALQLAVITKMVATIALQIGLLLGNFGAITLEEPYSITFDEQIIEIDYTDDNTNENQITRTDKEIYEIGYFDTSFDVLTTVVNESGLSQLNDLQVFFSDEKVYVSKISRLIRDTGSGYECNDFNASTSQIILKTCYGDHWEEIVLSDFSETEYQSLLAVSSFPAKDKKGNKAKKKIKFSLADKEIIILKITINLPSRASGNFKSGEVIIETLGSNGGYGHLR